MNSENDYDARARVVDALDDLFGAAGQDEYHYGLTEEGEPVGTVSDGSLWQALRVSPG